MRNLSLLIIGLLYSILVYSSEIRGYVITNNGNKINGYFFIDSIPKRGFKYQSMYQGLIFMDSLAKQKVVYKPYDIKEAYFYDPDLKHDYRFISNDIFINSGFIYNKRKVFLRQIDSGYLSLYDYSENQKTIRGEDYVTIYYWIQKQKGDLILFSKRKENDTAKKFISDLIGNQSGFLNEFPDDYPWNAAVMLVDKFNNWYENNIK